MRSCQPVAPGTGVRKAGGKEGAGCSERHLAAQVSALPFLPESFSCGPDLTAGGRAIAVLTSHLSDLALKRSLALSHLMTSGPPQFQAPAVLCLGLCFCLHTYQEAPLPLRLPDLGFLLALSWLKCQASSRGQVPQKLTKPKGLLRPELLESRSLDKYYGCPLTARHCPGLGSRESF